MPPFDSGQLNELLVRLKAGRGEALDGIYALAGSRMLALAQGIVHSRADAEDVVQDSFLKIVRSVRGYTAGTNGSAWIMRIVRNTAFDLLRKRKVRAEENIDAFFSLSDGRYSPERAENAILLEGAMKGLTEAEKRAIYYKYYLDFTVREIAGEMGLSKSSAQRLVERAESSLKMRLTAGQKDE